jgi:hypothetical protein
MLTADVLARDQGFIVVASCAQLWGQNWAEDQSRLFMVQTPTLSLPAAYDGAIVGYEVVTGPGLAPVDAQIPIVGSVWVDCGPDTSVDLEGYSVFHELEDGDRVLIGRGTSEVRDDTLALWNTAGLSVGTHVIVVEFRDTLGDTLEGFSIVRLDEAADALPSVLPGLELGIGRAAHGVRLIVTVPESDQVRLSVYDLAGRLVGVPLRGPMAGGGRTATATFEAIPGVYVARLESPREHVTRAFTIVH